MRKLLILSFFAAIAYAGCKKKEDINSIVVTKSVPTVTVTGSRYVSIPVGGSFTPPNATAYDSFYKEKLSVVKDLGTLNNTVPGLYVVAYTAKNKYGYVGLTNVYVAVTDISDSLDLSGFYFRLGNANRVAFVTKLSRGMFMTSNVGGVDTGDATTGPIVPAVFVVTKPDKFTFGSQVTPDGPLTSNSELLTMTVTPPDTTLAYAIKEASFGTQVRTFVKQ